MSEYTGVFLLLHKMMALLERNVFSWYDIDICDLKIILRINNWQTILTHSVYYLVVRMLQYLFTLVMKIMSNLSKDADPTMNEFNSHKSYYNGSFFLLLGGNKHI